MNGNSPSYAGVIALIIFLCALSYWGTTGSGFVYDDFLLIRGNPLVERDCGVSELFTGDIYKRYSREDHSYYRPIQILSYVVDRNIFGPTPSGYHVTNIVIHICIAILIFFLSVMLVNDRVAACLSATMFGVHPIQSQAVSYISGRADLLSALFMLVAIIVYVDYTKSRRPILLFALVLSYVCAILSKESGIVLPCLIIAYNVIFKVSFKDSKYAVYSVLFAMLLYALARSVLGIPFAPSVIPAPITERIPGSFAALSAYCKILLIPYPLHMEYGYRLFSWAEPAVLVGIGLFVVSLLYVSSKSRNRVDAALHFCVVWIFISLLPHSNLFPVNAYMAENWLYVPSIALFIAVGLLFSAMLDISVRRGYVYVGVVMALCSFLTIRQGAYWKDNVSFFTETIKHSPNNSKMMFNLGLDLLGGGKVAEAILSLEKAVGIDPMYVKAYTCLGIAYDMIGDSDKASAAYGKALAIARDEADIHYYMAVYHCKGDPGRAITEFQRAIKLNPNHVSAHVGIAECYYRQGDFPLALTHLMESSRLGARISPELIEDIKSKL